MDRYEYKLKLGEIETLAAEKNYAAAAEIADSINWRKVRNVNSLMLVGEIYQQTGRYEDSKELLLMAYDRSPIGKKIIYRLAEIAISAGQFDEAQEYYDEFVEIAPHDTLKYVLRYRMSQAKGEPFASQIAILNELKEQEYTEEWAFELAYLYHEAGMTDKCIEACDELILWFGDGPYVEKALELKMLYQPLNLDQEEKYKQFRKKKDGIIEVRPDEYLQSGEIINNTIKIPEVHVSADRFNTQNLQEELARGMQQIMEATEKETVNDTMDSIKKMVEEIPYLQPLLAEEGYLTEPVLPPEYETDEEIDGSLNLNFQEILEEEYDGQFSLSLPGGGAYEPQVSGQMTIDDVLTEWEKTKRAAEAAMQDAKQRKLESAKVRALQETGDLMERLSMVIAQLDEGVTTRELVEQVYDPDSPEFMERATQVFADANERLQEEIDRLQAGQGDPDAMRQMQPEEELPPDIPLDIPLDMPSYEPEDIDAELAAELEAPFEEFDASEEALAAELEAEGLELYRDPEPEPKLPVEEQAPPKPAEERPTESTWPTLFSALKKPVAGEAAGQKPQAAEPAEQMPQAAEPEEQMPSAAEPPGQMSSAGGPAGHVPPAAEPAEQMPPVAEPEEAKPPVGDTEKKESQQSGVRRDLENASARHLSKTFPNLAELLSFDAFHSIGRGKAKPPEQTPAVDSAADLWKDTKPEETAPPKAPSAAGRPVQPPVSVSEETVEEGEERFNKVLSDWEAMKDPTTPLPEISMDLFEDQEPAAESSAGIPEERRQPAPAAFSGIKKLDAEMTKRFSYFAKVDGMEAQICSALSGCGAYLTGADRGKGGNLIIEGASGCGKTMLATNLVKTLQQMIDKPGKQIGKINGDALNLKDVQALMEKISGGCLIIERVDELSRETLGKLSAYIDAHPAELLVILEDTKEGVAKALGRHDGFAEKFGQRITIPYFTNDELVEFAKTYAAENGYGIDTMAVLALYTRISSIQKLDQTTTLVEVKEIVDEAIDRVEKGSFKKMFGILTSKRYDENNYVVLHEKDFED